MHLSIAIRLATLRNSWSFERLRTKESLQSIFTFLKISTEKRRSLQRLRRITRFLLSANFSRLFPSNPDDEIANDSDVEEKHDDLCDGWMPVNFKNLQRNQGAGNHNSEPLGPSFREPKANPFG
jgi:hypothetical protein